MKRNGRKSVFSVSKDYLNPTWSGAYPLRMAESLQTGFFPETVPKEFKKKRMNGACLKIASDQNHVVSVKERGYDLFIAVPEKRVTHGDMCKHLGLKKSYVRKMT